MKKLILLSSILTLTLAQAKPAYLEGATVTVTLKNGETHTFSSDEYAVVKRNQMGKKKQTDKVVVKRKEKKNRIYGTIGNGFTGELNVSKSGDVHRVSSETGARVGIGYMRQVNENLNLGVQIKTNGDVDLTVGSDF